LPCARLTTRPLDHAARLVVTAGAEPDGVGGVHLWIVHDSESQRDKAEGGKGLPPVSFVQDLQGHEKPVNCVRFSPNGEFLATAGVEVQVQSHIDPYLLRSFGRKSTFHPMA